MTWLFSKRCARLLGNRELEVSIPRPARNRIWQAMVEFDEPEYRTDHTGFNYETSTLQELPGIIQAELGCEGLMAWPEEGSGSARASNLESFVRRTYIPAQLFDALEILYQQLSGDTSDPFQNRLNQIFDESGLQWRMANGKIFPVDSQYVEEDVIQKAYQLINEVEFQGALHEFEKARVDLTNKDWEGAINNANLSVESTIKGILGIERARPGELFRMLMDSGLVPEYYEGFLKVFEENILRCAAIIRNEELGAAHGQGIERNIIPPALAELAVHLAAVINIFLIKRHLERQRQDDMQIDEIDGDEEEIVF